MPNNALAQLEVSHQWRSDFYLAIHDQESRSRVA